MWARIVELMLAAWLAISPYIFGHDPESLLLWTVDYGAAAIVGTLALLSFYQRLHRAHLGTLPVAGLLVALAFLPDGNPPPPAYQNYMGVGVLLLMFAIIPSECGQPPRRWREYLREGAEHTATMAEDRTAPETGDE